MSKILIPGQSNLGLVENPFTKSKSYAGNAVKFEQVNVVTASVLRPRGLILNIPKEEWTPKDYVNETVWASILHNNRVAAGGQITMHRILGSTTLTSLGVFTAVACASTSFTTTNTDLSIGTITASVTTNEFTTIGCSRAAADTVSATTGLATTNAVASVNVVKTFTISGAGGTVYGAALFDQVVVAGSHLYVEALFGTSAVVISGDSLQVTWTVES